MNIKRCRLCNGEIHLVLSMGEMPIVNYFPTQKEFLNQKKYPLDFLVCLSCQFGQLGYLIPAKKLFKTYHYLSGASKPLIDHLDNLAKQCLQKFKLTKNSKVLDIGCNDGTFLKALKKRKE